MTCSHACVRFSLLVALLAGGAARAQGPKADGEARGVQDASAAQPAVEARGSAREQNEDVSVDMGSLLSAFARMPGLEARFSEEKHIALLARPLVSRGTLFFTRPALLLRRVESPELSEVVINRDALRVRDKAGEQTLDLRARKDIRPFVESLTWILAGERAALERTYTASFQPESQGAPWQLSLKPKVAPLSHLIAELMIRGRGLFVEQIEVRETSGDKTITRILSANPRRVFSAAERAKLFGERVPDGGARSAP
jgi:hypothetical protein